MCASGIVHLFESLLCNFFKNSVWNKTLSPKFFSTIYLINISKFLYRYHLVMGGFGFFFVLNRAIIKKIKTFFSLNFSFRRSVNIYSVHYNNLFFFIRLLQNIHLMHISYKIKFVVTTQFGASKSLHLCNICFVWWHNKIGC